MDRDREMDDDTMDGVGCFTIFLTSITVMACVLGFDREAVGVALGMLSFELWRFVIALKYLRRS